MRVYNPEGSALRASQKEMLKVLERFAQICKENNIQWWLCGGTLLGAARHDGFIPWDDDIDVSMTRKEYKKLKKILVNLKDDEFVYQCLDTDPDYVNIFGKFRIRNSYVESTDPRAKYFKYNGVNIDVFCIEESSRFAAHAAKFFYYELIHPSIYIKNSFWRHVAIRSAQALNFGLLLPLCRVIGWINPKKQCHLQLGSGFYKDAFYKEHIFPLTTIKFEGIEYPAPGNVDAYLTSLYGDWKKLPSDDKIRRSMHSPVYIKEIFGE